MSLLSEISNAGSDLNVSQSTIQELNKDAQVVGSKLYANYPAPPQPTPESIIINNTKNKINKHSQEINKRDAEIRERENMSRQQESETERKKQIMETRNRMLQLSFDRLKYKKKMIYALLSIIIFILIILLVAYSYFQRRMQ
jgi:uncharacterized protein (DUF3084 family)